MVRTCCLCLCALIAASAFAGSPVSPVVDGRLDSLYCSPLVIQDTSTNFGNSNLGQVGFANGSELDSAHAAIVIEGGAPVLYLFFAGNLESNGNKLEIFFDTRSGGQNQLVGDNPDVDFNGLNRMGANSDPMNGPVGPGLKFDAGFDADFYLTVVIPGGNNPAQVFASWAELRIDAGNPGLGRYLGQGFTAENSNNGELVGGDNPGDIRVTVDNSNTAGVIGGTGLDDGSDVRTGIEIRIPLSELGNPSGNIDVCAFINGQQHDFLSNQVLAGIFAQVADNLGEPRNVDFSSFTLFFDQFFTIPNPTGDQCGACCLAGQTCIETTESACMGQGGTWLGNNTSCDGNPCDMTPAGACCINGLCSIRTASECSSLGGIYLGNDVACEASLCAEQGACCVGTNCMIVIDEMACMMMSGNYRGAYSTCDGNPCDTGACCLPNGGGCQIETQDDCNMMDGVYQGNGTTCDNACIVGRCCIDNRCFLSTQSICEAQGGVYAGDNTNCSGTPCGETTGEPVIDGECDDLYGSPLAIQDTQTQFGDASQGLVDRAFGSELDSIAACVINDKLYLCVTGNVESNFNKFELFFDTIAGGQNRLRGDNPDVDFNGLNRMGDNGTGNGLTFDASFEPDYYFTFSHGGGGVTTQLFANFVRMRPDEVDPGDGFFLGEGRCANFTNGGMLDRNPGGNNPFGILVTLNNSNTAGVTGGTGPGDGSGVTTGVELCIPLSAIGNPTDDFAVCVFINGSSHDFMSNQVLGGIGGGSNFGEPRNVNFSNVPGNQFVMIPISCGGGPVCGTCGDSNCDGVVTPGDIAAFVAAVTGGEAGWINWHVTNLGSPPNCDYLCANDADGNNLVTPGDIAPFVARLTQAISCD